MVKQRTTQQNRAVHKYFALLAETLNEAGLDMRQTLKPDVDIPWTPLNIKTYLWKPIQLAQLHKESTADLTTDEVNKVYEVLNRHLGEKLGVHVEFPSSEEQLLDK